MSFPISFFKTNPTNPKLESSSCSNSVHHTVNKMEAKKVKGKQQDAFDPAAKKHDKSIIRPLTHHNFFYYYVPALGTASYTILSINVLNPGLRFTLFPKRDLTNILLATTLFGTGCYIFSRPHIQDSTKSSKYGYSALGSIMFNFSSVLLWAILRSTLPENVAMCSAAGLASCYFLVKGATNYLEFVESKISI